MLLAGETVSLDGQASREQMSVQLTAEKRIKVTNVLLQAIISLIQVRDFLREVLLLEDDEFLLTVVNLWSNSVDSETFLYLFLL